MREQILTTLGWTVIIFVLLAALKYFTGVDDWLMETLICVIPSTVGFFLGYGQSRRNKNR